MRKKQTRERKSFLRDNYAKCWSFIRESSNFVWIIVGIFFALALAGFFIPLPASISQQLMKYIASLVSQASGLPQFSLISFIFFNNARSSFFGLVLGIFLGIFPVFVSAFNGFVLGFVSKISVQSDGFLVLWKLLPHGIFELPAVFISLGMGLKIGVSFVKDRKSLKHNFYSALRVFLSVVLPLLLIAATIEGTLIVVMRP